MKRKAFTIIELLLVIAIPVVIILACMWTGRSMDYLLTWIKGRPVHCPWYLDALITFVGNGATLVFNIVMEVIRLVR